MPSSRLSLLFFTLLILALPGLTASAQQAGEAFPPASEVSDVRIGSVLFFNYYTSDIANPAAGNTRLNLTSHSAAPVTIHLFLVDGTSGSPADLFICLAGRQTISLFASDFDPGISGFAVAVAVSTNGCPVNFNFLSGSAWVRQASGHQGSLPAEAVAAIAADPGNCAPGATSTTLLFDGINYNRLPYQLAVDKIRSPADGNNTLLIINRIGGSLASGISFIGSWSGLLFEENGNQHAFIATGNAQLRQTLNDNFPRTTPVFSSLVPAGLTGWMKFGSNPAVALIGAVFNYNSGITGSPSAFTGGRNLRHFGLSGLASLTIPVRQSNCSS